MASIPSAVLSDRLKEVIGTRRLVSGVFLTFKFDPAFFEQEVVPVLLDVPLSHASVIRLVQLEDILRDSPGEIAVYYDVNGLVASDEGSAKLDIRRVPVRLRTGIFHAKNVFLLVEDERPSEGKSLRSLLVASLSANLTRAGWWENVESAHIEEIEAGSKSRLKDDLVQFLDRPPASRGQCGKPARCCRFDTGLPAPGDRAARSTFSRGSSSHPLLHWSRAP